jgi:hypothetical protein
MKHSTAVVEVNHISDGQLTVKLRCCSDASTDSVHTYDVGESTDQQIQDWLANRHAHVQVMHDRRERTRAVLASLKEAK